MSSEVKRPIYLDYQATTPVDPRVVEAMLPFFTEKFGNPASISHSYGNEALAAVESSRETIAKAINSKPQEIVFTSGATESINLAIKGVAQASENRGRHFITAATEHKAVLDCFEWLRRNGYETTILSVDSDGLISIEDLRSAIRTDTVMVSIMAANNEIGVLQPIQEIGKICRDAGVFFMTDATQAIGKIPLNVQLQNIDLLATSAHKVYGPKGIGMLYARRSNPRVNILSQIDGGGHERGMRSGTLPTPQIVGFAKAVELAMKEYKDESKRILSLRDLFEMQIKELIPCAILNGSPKHRIPSNLNFSFPGIEAEALIAALAGDLAISSGSACTSEKIEPSHVLQAIGCDPKRSRSSIRIGLGRYTTQDELNCAAILLFNQVKRLKEFSSLH
jgi:cysteine desulfurase